MIKRILIIVSLIIINSLLLLYYLNINKNINVYSFSYDLDPIIDYKTDIKLNKSLYFDLDKYIKIYYLDDYDIKHEINETINISLKYNNKSIKLSIPYEESIESKDNFIAILNENILYIRKTNNVTKLNKQSSYMDLLDILSKHIKDNNDYYIDLNEININQIGEQIIHLINNNSKEEISIYVEE